MTFQKAFLTPLFIFLIWMESCLAYSDSIYASHFFFKKIPSKDFIHSRDSELSNAQEYCIRYLKSLQGNQISVWSVSAESIQPDKINKNYSFICNIAYFKTELKMQKSKIFRLDQALDYLPLNSNENPVGHYITKVTRLPLSPYIKISITNIEPKGVLPIEWGIGSNQLSTQNEISMGKFQNFSLNTPLLTLKAQTEPQPLLELLGTDLTHPLQVKLQPSKSWLQFPTDFKWGIATSAHQIEGGNSNNDWALFEQETGHIFQNEKSELGPDHWNQLVQDILLLRKMGIHQYRMSIEWSRIEPREGYWDLTAVRHYRKEIRLLKNYGIEPIITLWHSTLPIWISQKNGWVWKKIPEAFEKFAGYIQKEIAPDVKYWITLNEPLLYLLGGYIRGIVPPAKQGSLQDLKQPLTQMLLAHALAYRTLHRQPGVKVGLAHRMDSFSPYNPNSFLDRWLAIYSEEIFNWTVPQAIKRGRLDIHFPFLADIEIDLPQIKDTQDFFGLNYYTRFALSGQLFPFDLKEHAQAGTQEVTQMGWEIYPEGMYLISQQIHTEFPNLPILITENGVADSTDRIREKYIRRHLVYLHYAIQKGIPIVSYDYWSLYDNFEWDQGYSIHVGLFSIDPGTKHRIPRKSSIFYRNTARRNGLWLF